PSQRWKYLPSVSILPQLTRGLLARTTASGNRMGEVSAECDRYHKTARKRTEKDEANHGVTHVPPRRLVSMLKSVPFALYEQVNSGSCHRPSDRSTQPVAVSPVARDALP